MENGIFPRLHSKLQGKFSHIRTVNCLNTKIPEIRPLKVGFYIRNRYRYHFVANPFSDSFKFLCNRCEAVKVTDF